MIQTTYEVHGMTCEGCEASIEKALSHLPGVGSARASHVTQTVEVDFNRNSDDDAVRTAVEDAGFDFVGPRAG